MIFLQRSDPCLTEILLRIPLSVTLCKSVVYGFLFYHGATPSFHGVTRSLIFGLLIFPVKQLGCEINLLRISK